MEAKGRMALLLLIFLLPYSSFAVTVNNGKFEFIWKIDGPVITFTVTAETTGYWAIGFSPMTGTMTGADIVMGFMRDGVGVLQHRRSTGQTTPQLVPDSVVYSLISASEKDGILTFVFSRPLHTDDPQVPSLNADGLNKLIWAVGRIPGANPLTHSARGQIDVNMSSGEAPARPTNYKDILLILHGIFMTFAWVICATVGIFVARFLKNKFGVWWFRLHILILVLAVCLNFAGFIFALFGTTAGTHFTHPHHLIGIVVLMGSFVQPLLGVVADRLFTPSRQGVPFFPDQLHWWIGRLTHLLGIVNVLFGIWLLQQRGGAPLVVFYLNYIFIGIVIVISVAVSLAFEATGGAVHHTKATQESKELSVRKQDATTSPLLQTETEMDNKKSE